MKNNDRNAGRKKKDTKPFTVRGYKETIDEIRKQAVLINKEYEKSKELSKNKNNA